MKQLQIEWRHLGDRTATCSRCAATGRALDDVMGDLADELTERGVRLVFTETVLGADDVAASNVLLFNGVPLEQVVQGARAAESHCGTVKYAGQVYEDLPAGLIREAALTAARTLAA
jgi:hypothetical protein